MELFLGKKRISGVCKPLIRKNEIYIKRTKTFYGAKHLSIDAPPTLTTIVAFLGHLVSQTSKYALLRKKIGCHAHSVKLYNVTDNQNCDGL